MPALDLEGKRIHIVGASGIEGTALLLYLAGEQGIEGIVAHDFSPDTEEFARSFHKTNTAWDPRQRQQVLEQLLALPAHFCLGDHYLDGIHDAEVIFASQNWFNYPANRPALDNAIANGAKMLGILDLGLSIFTGCRITVTGSNGKSTTSALIGHLLNHCVDASVQVLVSGNERSRQVPLSEIERAAAGDFSVWEVSNRHLRDRTVQGDIAVLTNITLNHVEDHGSWEAYVVAKSRLVLAPGPGGHAVLSAVDPQSIAITDQVRASGATLWLFGQRPAADSVDGHCWIDEKRLKLRRPDGQELDIGDVRGLPLPGDHNLLNLQAALCAVAACGFTDTETLHNSFTSVPGLSGRLETVAESDGVRWIYDIQATTAPAAAAGIEAIGAITKRIVLIVGGEDKGMDFTAMAEQAARHCDVVLALPGSGTDAFLRCLEERCEVLRCPNLEDALVNARLRSKPGDSVLLSPGCAFFYRAYIDGGPSYLERVRRMLALNSQQKELK
jgi:UDP-N-acetylmuramoylalanine--D-glutamate ligase